MNGAPDERAARFWARVRRRSPAACWPWTGSITRRDSSGRVKFGGRTIGAHRLAWILTHGEPPPGHVVERCVRDGRCCNVLHLRLRPPRPKPARGRPRLTPAARTAIVAAMRAEREAGATLSQLARRYGLHAATVSRSVRTIPFASGACATYPGQRRSAPCS